MTTRECARQDNAQRAQRGLRGAHSQDRDSPGNTSHQSPRETQTEGAGRGRVEFSPGALAGGDRHPGCAGTEGETSSQRDRDPEMDGHSVPGWTPG